MNELEYRLRQRLHEIAQRLASAGLRPRREAAARDSPARAPWLAPAAMVAVAAVLAGPGLAGCGQRAGHELGGGTQPDRPAAAADPPLVAVAGSSQRGSSSRIELISPSSGRVAKVVARVVTGNGFALSPDSRDLYVVGSVGRAIEIRRISIATGKVSFVADGAYPAVSPDGRHLAYATGHRFSKVEVIDLRSLLGKDGNLLNQGGISWLGDGDEVIAVPGFTASALAAEFTAHAGGNAGGGQAPPGRQSLIVIKIRSDGLAARRIVVPDPYQEPFGVISGDLSQRRALLIARIGFGAAGTITRVSLHGGGYRARVIARLPRGVMPVVIAPRGDRVLYLVGHTPPALWAAAIKNGRLTGQHRLLTDTSEFGVDQAAW